MTQAVRPAETGASFQTHLATFRNAEFRLYSNIARENYSELINSLAEAHYSASISAPHISRLCK